MKPKLYPFQREGVKHYHKHDGVVLNADDMGLGKTLQTLTYWHETPEARPRLVVCPASLKTNWAVEARKFYNMDSAILETTRPTIYKSYRSRDLLIINYDILGPWMPFLQSLNLQNICLDEGQMISGINSARTKNSKILARGVPHRQILTGTPVMSRVFELYPMLNILWPEEFDSPFSFGFEYCEPEKDGAKYVFKGASNIAKLHKKLKKLGMLRRQKSKVLSELPPKRQFVLPLDIERPEVYRQAEGDLIQWLASFDPARAKRAERAERFVKFGYLKRLATELKMKAVFGWVDVFLQSTDRKLILGAIHRLGSPHTIELLMKRYGKCAVTIHGGCSQKEKDKAKSLFQNDPNIRIMVLQVQSGGVGLNLQGEKRTVAMVEFPWTSAAVRQFIDRAHRIGTKDYVDVYYLIARHTIESKLCRLLQHKEELGNLVIDGVNRTADSLSIFDRLQQILLKERKK